MSDSVSLRFKTVDRGRGTSITEMQVAELLDVDGRPYRPSEDFDDLREAVAYLSGRLDSLERLVQSEQGGRQPLCTEG